MIYVFSLIMECKAITHWRTLAVISIASLLLTPGNAFDVSRECKVWADPPGNLTFSTVEKMREGMRQEVLIEIPHCYTNQSTLTFEVEDIRIADVVEVFQMPPDEKMNRSCWAFQVVLLGKRLGMTPVFFSTEIIPGNHTDDVTIPGTHVGQIDVIVMRPDRIVDVAFRAALSIFIIVLNLGFGCTLDLQVVKEILRRPIAPVIGFCCQFCCMPLLGVAVTKAMQMDNIFAFGLLTLSCCPGGGGSNVWSVLLHGDVNLSLTMTFFSLIACLVMMPFWLFTLSRFYVDPSQVQIPFKDILITLGAFVIPCLIGIVIRKKREHLGAKLGRMIKPLAVVFIIFIITCTPYVNMYIYKIMGQIPSLVPPAMMLPWCGFTIGFIAAKLLGQPHYRAITIAIETGIQNFGIALVVLQQSFPQPFGNLAAVMPVITAHFTPAPLYLALAFLTIRDKCWKRWRNKKQADDPEKMIEDEEVDGDDRSDTKDALMSNGKVRSSIEEDDEKISSALMTKMQKELMSLDVKETVL